MFGKSEFFVNGYDIFVTFGGAATHYLIETDAAGINMPVIAHQVTAVHKDSSPSTLTETLINYWRLFLNKEHVTRFVNDFINRAKQTVANNKQDLPSRIYSDYLYIFVKGAAKKFKKTFEQIGIDYSWHQNEDRLKVELQKELVNTAKALIEKATSAPTKIYSQITKSCTKLAKNIVLLSKQQAESEREIYRQAAEQVATNPYGKAKVKDFLEDDATFMLIENNPPHTKAGYRLIASYDIHTGIFTLPNQATVRDYLERAEKLNYKVASQEEFRQELLLHELEHAKEYAALCPLDARITCEMPLRLRTGQTMGAIKRKIESDLPYFDQLKDLLTRETQIYTLRAKQLIVYAANLIEGKAEVPGIAAFEGHLEQSIKLLQSFFYKADRIVGTFQVAMQFEGYSPEQYLTEWLGHSAQMGLTPQAEAFLLPSTYELRSHLYPELDVHLTFPIELGEWLSSALTIGAGSILATEIMCPTSPFYSFFSPRSLLYQASSKLLAAPEATASPTNNTLLWQILILAVGASLLVWYLMRWMPASKTPAENLAPNTPEDGAPSLRKILRTNRL